MKYYKKIKYNRVSFYFIHALIDDKSIRIGKDFGTWARSKPLYFVEVDGEIWQHGFNTQKEAKQYVLSEVLK